jgi:hypothetical protein
VALAVASIVLCGAVAHMRGLAQVCGQLGFQHPLDQAFGQLL